MGLFVNPAKQWRSSAQNRRGAKDGMRGAIAFIVRGSLLVEVVPIFDRTGADAQESEDQENGGEATQDKEEYAVLAGEVNNQSLRFIWLASHEAVRWRRRLVTSRCWWAMLFCSAGSLESS